MKSDQESWRVCSYRNCKENAREGSAYCSSECERYDARESNLSDRRRVVLSAVPVSALVTTTQIRVSLLKKPLIRGYLITSDLEYLEKHNILESKLLDATVKRKRMRLWRRKK
jgi:hypothetical protein